MYDIRAVPVLEVGCRDVAAGHGSASTRSKQKAAPTQVPSRGRQKSTTHRVTYCPNVYDRLGRDGVICPFVSSRPTLVFTRTSETPPQAFGLGVGVSELVVARSGRDENTGGYQYTVVFLEETEAVPQIVVSFDTYRPDISKVQQGRQ